MAGGFTIDESKIEIFKNFSKKNFQKLNLTHQKIKS